MKSNQQFQKKLDKVNISKVSKSLPKRKVSEWNRKQQPFILFILVNICEFYSALQIYVFFRTTMNPAIPWDGVFGPIVGTTLFRILIFLINCFYMGGIRTTFYALTMLDILGVLSICTASIFVAFEVIINIPMKQLTDPLPILTYMLIPLNTFFCVGSFRLMMMTCKWTPLYVVIYKLKLYACCFFFISYGLLYEYYKSAPLEECQPCDPFSAICQRSCTQVTSITIDCCMDVDNLYKSGIDKINQFFVLFLAMSLAYSAELIAVMSDFDGMAQLKGHFTLGFQEDVQQKKNLLGKTLRKPQVKNIGNIVQNKIQNNQQQQMNKKQSYV